MIDLRSDTVTKPTQEMRAAMARAEVGDDVYGDDPTVRRLEERTAEILGKESAVFMPTGTMSNQVALRTHTEAGDEVLADISAHVVTSEGGAPAGLSGILVRPLLGKHGIFTASDVLGAVRVPHPFYPRTLPAPTKLVCVENTHNGGGGTIWPLEGVREVALAARSRGLALHLDGARLWNASVATGIPESEYAAVVDSVSVCFSKGLGAPVGSSLAGRRDFIERARRFKQMFGGGFRQAGVLAAAALHALEHHRSELLEDHQKASELAAGLAALPGIDIDTNLVQTNILRFRVTSMTAAELVEGCFENGVHMLPSGEDRVRAVLHRDIRRSDVSKVLSILEKTLTRQRKSSALH
ncbi:MAG TPA: GntG family PLP-dependent aldolase [Vicinamibacteria bacterium]|nr:GntG family PLP-dependent aldolase [Vicinamibacteria bacterium]